MRRTYVAVVGLFARRSAAIGIQIGMKGCGPHFTGDTAHPSPPLSGSPFQSQGQGSNQGDRTGGLLQNEAANADGADPGAGKYQAMAEVVSESVIDS
jgi:hypothetical protein